MLDVTLGLSIFGVDLCKKKKKPKSFIETILHIELIMLDTNGVGILPLLCHHPSVQHMVLNPSIHSCQTVFVSVCDSVQILFFWHMQAAVMLHRDVCYDSLCFQVHLQWMISVFCLKREAGPFAP